MEGKTTANSAISPAPHETSEQTQHSATSPSLHGITHLPNPALAPIVSMGLPARELETSFSSPTSGGTGLIAPSPVMSSLIASEMIDDDDEPIERDGDRRHRHVDVQHNVVQGRKEEMAAGTRSMHVVQVPAVLPSTSAMRGDSAIVSAAAETVESTPGDLRSEISGEVDSANPVASDVFSGGALNYLTSGE